MRSIAGRLAADEGGQKKQEEANESVASDSDGFGDNVGVWRTGTGSGIGAGRDQRAGLVDEWIGQKFQYMLNDLYDTIKQQYPKVNVYQWVELRGYGNISGYFEYIDGNTLKMDGYVLEWFDVFPEELVDTPQGKASVKTSYFERYMNNLMARNHLKPEQILGQVWASNPTSSDTLEQIENVSNLGIPYIYFFWPDAATPEIFDLFGANDTPGWKYACDVWSKVKPLIEAERKRKP